MHIPYALRPRRVRAKLTLLFGVLFIANGAALLTVTYLLVRRASKLYLVKNIRVGQGPAIRSATGPIPIPDDLDDVSRGMLEQGQRQHAAEMQSLLTWSLVALAVTAVLAILLGWLLAGRLLR